MVGRLPFAQPSKHRVQPLLPFVLVDDLKVDDLVAPGGGTNSAQLVRRLCLEQISKIERLYSVPLEALEVDALGFDDEDLVEAIVGAGFVGERSEAGTVAGSGFSGGSVREYRASSPATRSP